MTRIGVAFSVGALVCAAASASAQPQQTGPMVVERLQSGPVASPEVKITDVDGHLSTLVGGEGGWMLDNTFFVGGAGFWLVNGSHDLGMGYGGVTLHWWWNGSGRVGIGGKGLVGGGTATLSDTFTSRVIVRGTTIAQTRTIPFNRGFFIAEPEADAFVRLGRHFRVTGGVGYRLIGSDGQTDNRLRGLAGTVGVQIF